MKHLLYMIAFLCFAGVIIQTSPAMADCTDPAGKKGEIAYNSDYQAFQGCDGSNWVAFHDPQCPAGDCDPCKTGPVGTVCTSDGAVYAGTTVGGVRMYVATADESGTYAWGGQNTDFNGDNNAVEPELLEDGLANTNWLLLNGNGSHDAAQACRDKGSDWYLPAREEYREIYDNRAQLGTANLPTDTTIYWSSSERDGAYAWLRRFSDGWYFYNGKNGLHPVRCVRR